MDAARLKELTERAAKARAIAEDITAISECMHKVPVAYWRQSTTGTDILCDRLFRRCLSAGMRETISEMERELELLLGIESCCSKGPDLIADPIVASSDREPAF